VTSSFSNRRRNVETAWCLRQSPRNQPIVDSYAVPKALDEDFAADFGTLSVHEVKTDPRPGVNLAYFS
jgi:hypothetical protein